MSQSSAANVLVISPTPSHPQTAGNRARIFTLLSQIRELGHRVHFLYVNKEDGDVSAMKTCWDDGFYEFHYKRQKRPLHQFRRKLCKRMGLSCAYTFEIDELYDQSLDAFIQTVKEDKHFDVVMVEYVFLSRVLQNFDSGVLKIIDTHDAFTDRHEQYLAQGETPKWFSTSSRQEGRGLNRADAIIAIQQHEADLFSRISSSKVITIGHIVKLFTPEQDNVVRGRILMLGSSNQINIKSADYFIQDILPIIRNRNSHAELVIAGSVGDTFQGQPGVVCLGEVQDLRPVYQSAEIVINPVLFGTGLKVKSLEALSHARPLVTTSAGAVGLEDGIGRAFLVSDDIQGFADAVTELLDSPETVERLSLSAHDYVKNINQQYIDRLDALLNLQQVA